MGAGTIGRVNGPRLGRGMARFNRSVTNHLTRRLAGRVPGMAVVIHCGRRSGREYRNDETRAGAPQPARTVLGLVRVSDFLRLRE